MKKRKILILILIALSLIVGCGQNNDSENTNKDISNNQDNSSNDTNVDDSNNQNKEEDKAWGISGKFAVHKNNKLARFFINFPTYVGIPKGSGLISYDDVGSLIIVDAEVDENNIQNVDEVLPTLFEQTKMTLDLYRNSAYDDFEFEITSKKHTTINEYEMCKYTGVHSFTYDDEPKTMNFVAYSTQIKSNGGYIYWIVLDQTDNQSLSKTIDSHAYNMALSLNEK